MAKGRWQAPKLTCSSEFGDEVFAADSSVPVLTPEAFDPDVATEELERAQAGAGAPERGLEVEELNRIYHLPDNSAEALNG
jgi:hypothetical protein